MLVALCEALPNGSGSVGFTGRACLSFVGTVPGALGVGSRSGQYNHDGGNEQMGQLHNDDDACL